jgi:GT2 family glycosyltransferase/tetratricopeptide (TPR) repeat protein/2-polyprenyl-3-methyl-5-hydroxy-6-metoxy-1,4-benzoquinol methylase
MARVAVMFDHLLRSDTTGVYCLRALADMAQVEQFHPSQLADVRRTGYDLYLFIDDGLEYPLPGDLRPQAYWAIDTHMDFSRERGRAAGADFVFAAQKNGAEQLSQSLGRQVEWLPLACDPLIHARQDMPVSFNVSFVGNLIGQERMRLLELLRSEIAGVHIGRHYFEEMAAVFSASRVVFNRSVVDDINMRVFEALCSGSLLMTNDLAANGQEELFQDAKHLVTYDSDEELLDKLRFYLMNDASRERIAAAGRQEVLASHTYRQRMERVLEVVLKAKSKGGQAEEGVGCRVSGVGAGPVPVRLGPDPHYFEFSRPEVLALVPLDARRILDIGCGAGQLGRALKNRQNCMVYGVELNGIAAERASAHLDRVWTGDMETMELDLPPASLDVIVCGDVLEHLRDPREVLRRLSRYLHADGRLIASIPNVAHHSVIRGLLAGNWNYEPAGLLDETHLRFFTAREIEKLFFRAGYRIERMETVRGPGDERFAIDGGSRPIRLGRFNVGELSPESVDSLTAYQYLVVATPAARNGNGRLTSIVMLTNNQLEYTKLCLSSIRCRTDEPYEVIIVDNGSTDGTVDYLRNVDGVRLIVNPENRGFPAAVNQGIAAARGDYILLLNNDCIVTTGWLARLLAAIESAPDVGLAGPCSNCVSGEQQIAVDYEQLSDVDGFAWEWAKRQAGRRVETDRLVAFCLLVKRSVIDRIGVLDERFGLGNFEDDDFCRRALAAGFKAVIAQDAFVHHFGSVTFRAMGIDFASLLHHNQRLFQEKWNADSEQKPNPPPIDHWNVNGLVVPPSGGQTRLKPELRTFTDLPNRPILDKLSSPRFELNRCDKSGPRLVQRQQVGQAPPDGGTSVGGPRCQAQPDLRPRLSLCMIVRDSARTLGACLESIRPWVDEMIVVDTGSKDKTPEMAKKYGAKIFHFPWCDDFSAARNESLSHATSEWLFWMDSDDTIDAENGRKLRELVDGPHRPETIAYVAQVHCPHEQDGPDYTAVDHVKLFRNLPELRFEGRIHEQILPAINRLGGTVAWTDIFVVHSGSDHSLDGQARKLERDLRLLRLEERERPNHPFTLFNLGMTHLEMKRFDEATHYLERTIAVAGPQESHVPKAFSLLIQALSETGQMDDARKRCDEGLARYPDDPELIFRSGALAQHSGRPWDAERYYRKILDDTFAPRFRSIDRGIVGYKTRQNLANLYHDQGRHAEAEAQWRLILTERPDYQIAWKGLATALLKQRKFADAREAVRQCAVICQSPALVSELDANIEEAAGNVTAAQRILEQAVAQLPDNFELRDALCRLLFEHGDLEEAENALQTLVEKFPDNAAGLYNLATIRLRRGEHEAAARSFLSSIALRPNFPAAYDHLATCYRELGRPEDACAMLARARSMAYEASPQLCSRISALSP